MACRRAFWAEVDWDTATPGSCLARRRTITKAMRQGNSGLEPGRPGRLLLGQSISQEAPMIEQEIAIPTKAGAVDTFICHPERGGPWPVILFLMDAPGIREELR